MRRFVLFDRDGTLIHEKHYLSDTEQVELIDGVANGLRLLRDMGLGLIAVTNQSGIGRGFFDHAQLTRVHDRMVDILRSEDVHLDGIYFCPHLPEEKCSCRKPAPGLIERAAQDFKFDPRECFIVGDKACDIELGQAVHATTFLVRTGYGADVERAEEANPDYVVDNAGDVVAIIRDKVQ
jgi:D-glycero-D-manno-heptose 1,7-bisphosphate phosphatase